MHANAWKKVKLQLVRIPKMNPTMTVSRIECQTSRNNRFNLEPLKKRVKKEDSSKKVRKQGDYLQMIIFSFARSLTLNHIHLVVLAVIQTVDVRIV